MKPTNFSRRMKQKRLTALEQVRRSKDLRDGYGGRTKEQRLAEIKRLEELTK